MACGALQVILGQASGVRADGPVMEEKLAVVSEPIAKMQL
jgi:hypothetical protein